jgi:Holliday junction resolvasome RuvABC ATP-dependent DNA helicase subunit
MDRCDRVDLEEYQPEHLCSIIQKDLPAVEWEPETLLAMASVLRGNARSAVELCKKVRTFLTANNLSETGPVFNMGAWKNLMFNLGILPFGLTRIELQLLRILYENKDMSLTALSAKTMMSRESLQRDVELYLQKLNLMQIDTTGRNITVQGCNYIKEIDTMARAAQAAVAVT